MAVPVLIGMVAEEAIIVARDLDAVLATYEVAAATRTLPTDQVLDLGYAGE